MYKSNKINIKYNAFMKSIQYCHYISAERSIRTGIDLTNPNLLVVATTYGHLEIVKLLINNNVCDEKISVAISRACENNHEHIAELLIKKYDNLINKHAIELEIDNIKIRKMEQKK